MKFVRPQISQSTRSQARSISGVAGAYRFSKSLSVLWPLALLAACSGGGGDSAVGNDAQQTGQYSIAGTVSLSQTSAIDSDTNDPNQVGRTVNNSFDTAQSLANPTLLVGYVNVPGGGPEGPSRAGGDLTDGFKTRLQAGQVIEVQFAADPAVIDVDLYLFNQARQIVGRSIGENSYECLQVATDGDYTIVTQLFTNNGASRGGTVYQLRIGAPGGASTCPNGTGQSAALVAGEVVAQRLSEPALAKRHANKSVSVMPAPVTIKGDITQARSALLAVPTDLPSMLMTHGLTKAADSQEAIVRLGGALPQQALRELETIAYAKMLAKSGDYVYAFPNFRLLPLQVQPFPPNDREYAKQRWHYEAIDLPGAINQLANQRPAPTYVPIVAVLDSGIVAEHPDLANQLVTGYDFIRDPATAGDGNGIDANPSDADNSSTNAFHGTHVAGTVAAQTDNGIGGAGVAPMAKIMPLRVLGARGGTFYDIEQGLRFAAGQSNDSNTIAARKADIINMSLGSTSACNAGSNTLFRSLRDLGVIVVAASGNDSSDNELKPVSFPANCSDVIAIGATNPFRTRAYYSNGGAALLAVAPGGDMRRSTTGNGLDDGVYSTVASANGTSRQPSYAMLQGTSMASPHAAGIFALMRYIAPTITATQVFDAITSGAIVDELGVAGRDNEYGYGQLNARKAVEFARQLAGVAPPTAGNISALPSSLSLGSISSSVEFELRVFGDSAERVSNVTTSSNRITVQPKPGTIDAQTGLGVYVVSADAQNVDPNAATFADVIVTLTPAREIRVPVNLSGNGSGGSGGDLGPIYILVLDASSDEQRPVVQTVVSSPSNGGYAFELSVPGTSKIILLAGSDTDNDGSICKSGEACGAYPLLGNSQTEVLMPTGNLSGLNFSVAPFGGIKADSAARQSLAVNRTTLLPSGGSANGGIVRLTP